MTEPTFKLEQSEAQFQAAVEQLASMKGWEWMHIDKSTNDRGYWRTPIRGSLGSGFPDLMLVKGLRMVYAEVKAQRGQLSVKQKRVMAVLSDTGAEVYVWRPSDWDAILELLS